MNRSYGIAAWLLLAAPLSGQSPTADSLWASGNYAAARVEYERSLHDNPGWVRALYRLAVLASWDGQTDSALALLADAREIEPAEPSVRAYEAKMYAWQGKYRAAIVRYDSLLAEDASNRDARFGRAQANAWRGRQPEADREFRALVEADPGDTEALVALAQLLQWQSRPEEASHYAELALRAAPEDRAALEITRQARALSRPRLEVTLGFSHDSDDNNAAWQSIGTSFIAADGLRAFGSVGALEASDPVQDGTRLHGEVGATWWRGNLSLTGAAGARRLRSDFGIDRSTATARAGLALRLSPVAGVGLGYAHYSFDETALLIGKDLDIDEFSADGDVELTRSTSLGVGGGVGVLADGNQRRSGVIVVTQRVAPRITAGLYGRSLSYRKRGAGYFAPDRFLVGEVRAAWSYAVSGWQTRLSGGVGLQQVGKHADSQSQWHLEGRAARQWATINELALAAGYSNSAVSSTTGAFNYYSLVLSLRLGL